MGAVIRVIFREKARKTALQGASGESQVLRAGSFERGPLPQDRRVEFFPSSVRHDFVTWGARVYQVGVNPLRRAVAVVGVDAVKQAK